MRGQVGDENEELLRGLRAGRRSGNWRQEVPADEEVDYVGLWRLRVGCTLTASLAGLMSSGMIIFWRLEMKQIVSSGMRIQNKI